MMKKSGTQKTRGWGGEHGSLHNDVLNVKDGTARIRAASPLQSRSAEVHLDRNSPEW